MCGVGSNWDTNLCVFDDRFTKTLSPWMILGYFRQREALIFALGPLSCDCHGFLLPGYGFQWGWVVEETLSGSHFCASYLLVSIQWQGVK